MFPVYFWRCQEQSVQSQLERRLIPKELAKDNLCNENFENFFLENDYISWVNHKMFNLQHKMLDISFMVKIPEQQ